MKYLKIYHDKESGINDIVNNRTLILLNDEKYFLVANSETLPKDAKEIILEDNENILYIKNFDYPICVKFSSSDAGTFIVNYGYSNEETVLYEAGNNQEKIFDYKIYNIYCNNNETIFDITLPDTIVELPNNCFEGCKNITTISIPYGVTSIGNLAFADCDNLNTLYIGRNVKSIGEEALAKCSNLTYIKSLPIIAPTVYSNTFGNSEDDYTGRLTYADCSNLLEVPGNAVGYESNSWLNVLEHKDKCGFNVLYDNNKIIDDEDDTELPPDNEIWYTTTDGNVIDLSTLLEEFTAYTKYRYTLNYFEPSLISNTYNNGIGKLTFDNNISIILDGGSDCGGDWGAFVYCTTLNNIILPTSLTYIGNAAFRSCYNLSKIILPNTINYISYRAFAFDNNLTYIKMPISLTYIEAEAFDRTGLLYINMIDTCVNYIGYWCFIENTNLTCATLPSSLTYIYGYSGEAFRECDNLTKIIYDGTIEECNNIGISRSLWNSGNDIYILCKDGIVSI